MGEVRSIGCGRGFTCPYYFTLLFSFVRLPVIPSLRLLHDIRTIVLLVVLWLLYMTLFWGLCMYIRF